MSDSRRLVAERYRLMSQIGSGGMGRVWLARDEMLHRDVAIKEVVLPVGLTDAERAELVERTLREARAAGRLSHPNVVAIYDVVTYQDRPWIVMEFVPSRSLYQVIREDGPLPPKRVAEIGLHVLAALQAAHRAGVWHRDVKPGNVLLATDGRVVLTDFGLAAFQGDDSATRSGLILGSAQYISPERARDGASGPASDMWSLGATLYAAVEGRSPYARETSMQTLTALATAPPDTPRRAGPLRGVLIGLLRKNPKHRFNGAETEKMLRRVVAGEVKPRGRAPRPREAPDDLAEVPAAHWLGAEVPPGRVAQALVLNRQPAGHLRTVTEETARYRRRGSKRWLWLVAATIAALGIAAGTVALTSRDRPVVGAGAQPTPSREPSPLTPAAGVQACAAAPDNAGQPVLGVAKPSKAPWQVLEGWTVYTDSSGFFIAVPTGWRTWRDGALLCFRDPLSLRAAAVISNGALSGSAYDLLNSTVPGWEQAAKLVDYQQIGLRKRMVGDDGAELEYTYKGGHGLGMHGMTLMQRSAGQVYQLCWLSTDYAWPSEQGLVRLFQPSFGLAQ